MVDNLNDFRGPAQGERPEHPADDREDGHLQNEREPIQADAPADGEVRDDPLGVIDPRAEMARRFKERRAAARAGAVPRSHVPSIDGDMDPNDPDYIADEDEARREGEEPTQARTPEPQPTRQPTPGAKRFELKVDGNTFQVSREELVRYAEVDEADAGSIPEVALQRLAQKQLAANARLEAAKREREASRTRRPDAELSGIPADEERADPDDTRQRTGRKPAAETVDMIRDIQYGDPEEAAAKVEALFEGQFRQRETQRSQSGILDEVNNSIANFGKANADLASDDISSDLLRSQMVRGIVDDLRQHGITDAEATQLLSDHALASKAYVGARIAGLAVRPMSTILDDAGNKVRARFGGDRRVDPTPQPGNPQLTSRRDEKRMLVPQPAPSGMPPRERSSGSSTLDRRAVASARVQAMRASRFQS